MGRGFNDVIDNGFNMNDLEKRIRRGESFLVASDGQFLGKLCLNRYDQDGVCNEYGRYGSRYSSTSIFNQYSTYGSVYSALSPFSQYTHTPPKVYLRGQLWGLLTVNTRIYARILNPHELNNWMAENGLNY